MKKPLGYIAYEGPSMIDGRPIVVIVNKIDGSDNAKTGAIVQSFIIRSDVAPTDALKTGDDVSICGQCVHRPILAKTNGAAPCYVNVGRSVRSVYEAYKRGRYERASVDVIAAALAGKIVRLGTYGDPAGFLGFPWAWTPKRARRFVPRPRKVAARPHVKNAFCAQGPRSRLAMW